MRAIRFLCRCRSWVKHLAWPIAVALCGSSAFGLTDISIALTGSATLAGNESTEALASGDTATFGIDATMIGPSFDVRLLIQRPTATNLSSTREKDFGRNILTLDRSGDFMVSVEACRPRALRMPWLGVVGISGYVTGAGTTWEVPDTIESQVTLLGLGGRFVYTVWDQQTSGAGALGGNFSRARVGLGPALRYAGGDITDSKSDLELFLGEDTQLYGGVELAAEILLNRARFYGVLSWMTSSVQGIMNLQGYVGMLVSGDIVKVRF